MYYVRTDHKLKNIQYTIFEAGSSWRFFLPHIKVRKAGRNALPSSDRSDDFTSSSSHFRFLPETVNFSNRQVEKKKTGKGKLHLSSKFEKKTTTKKGQTKPEIEAAQSTFHLPLLFLRLRPLTSKNHFEILHLRPPPFTISHADS